MQKFSSSKPSKSGKTIKKSSKQIRLGNRWSSLRTPVIFVLFVVPFALVGSYLIWQSSARQVPQSSKAVVNPEIERDVKRLTAQLLASTKQLESRPDNAALVDKVVATAQERQNVMLELIKQDPNTAKMIGLSARLKQSLPAQAQVFVEDAVTVEGELQVIHGENVDDDGNPLESLYYYTVITDQGELSVNFPGKGPTEDGGRRVKVDGIKIGNNVAATTDTSSYEASGEVGPTTAAVLNKKVAVILINFNENTTQPWTQEQIRTSTFTGNPSVNGYFQENSFNKIGLAGKNRADGDIYGWYTIPNSISTCDYNGFATSAKNAATAAGADLTGYNNFIYMFPRITSCSWAGLANMPGTSSWINGYGTNQRIVAHELGHNFSVHHAATYSCKDGTTSVTLSTSCTSQEYGDPYNVMGSTYTHFSNYNKGRMNYFSSTSNTVTAVNAGTYTIEPVEKTTTGLQTLRVVKEVDLNGVPTKYYYLEFRQPSIYDKFASTSPVVNGVSIRIAPDYTRNAISLLLDTTPETVTFSDAPLAVGKTFTDSTRGVNMTVKSVSSAGAVVDISYGTQACSRANPSVAVAPTGQWAFPGDSLAYSMTVTNNDSSACPASTFNYNSSVPAGLTQAPAGGQLSLAPSARQTVAISVVSSTSIASGYYTFTQNVSNASSAAYIGSANANYNVYSATDTVAPVATISAPANGTRVSKSVSIRASATDNVAVSSMEVYIDGQRVASASGGAITYSWNTNGKRVSSGQHTIEVRAHDAAGNTGRTSITVTK